MDVRTLRAAPAFREGPATVSVALCTYDGMPFVVQQVETILAQSHVPDEIVLADDGSRDGTVATVREVVAASSGSARAVRLRLLDPAERRLGVTANFDRAVAACSGDVIVLADQDDVWHPEKIARLVRELEADPQALLVASNARLVDRDGEPLGRDLFATLGVDIEHLQALAGPGAVASLLRGNVLPGMTFGFRRELVGTALPIPAPWPHDYWLAVLAAASGGLRVLEETLVDYRQHGGNAVGVPRRTLGYRLHRLMHTPPTAQARVARVQALLSRLPSAGTPSEDDLLVVRRTLEFHETRSRLPRRRALRVPPIARLVLGGTYAAHARNGNIDAVRDLLTAEGA